jgi:thiamine-monophosphate kinase
LAMRYHLPEPRLGWAEALRRHASACADVSDGLAADADHIAAASRVALRLALDRLPLSPAAKAWLSAHDRASGLAELAGLGDDYELVITAAADQVAPLAAAANAAGVALTDIGEVEEGGGVTLEVDDRPAPPMPRGWTHS